SAVVAAHWVVVQEGGFQPAVDSQCSRSTMPVTQKDCRVCESMELTMIKLYGTPPTRALRAIWLLNELGLEYQMLPVDILKGETREPDFLALNPAGKVPVLVDGDLVITESSAIQLYLADKYSQAGFIPETVEDRAKMYRWIFFLATEIEQPLWRIARNTFLYTEEKQLPQDVDLARQEKPEMLAVLEQHMKKHQIMVADNISVTTYN